MLRELAAAPVERDERWEERPLEELIDHLITRYHEPLRQDLPAWIDAARKVERVHAAKPSCPHGLTEVLMTWRTDMDLHLGKEEQVLFPAILEGTRGLRLAMPIRVMLQEHEDHGATLLRLRALTHDFVPPAEACSTWRALYEGLARLEEELMRHVHLENHVLFPRALDG